MQQGCSDGDDRLHDYMSDDFVTDLGDLRPGLLNRKDIRKAKVEKHYVNLPKSKKAKVIEEEAREKGLSEPISAENKGFAILQKMGYKEGTSLGRSGTRKTSPVPIIMKDGKSGLGRHKFVLRRQHERKAEEAQKYVDFRQRKQTAQLTAKVQLNLKRSKLACHQLDKKCGYSSPVMDWYWPEQLVSKVEAGSGSTSDSDEGGGGEEEDKAEPTEQLESITSYLRLNHHYCIWCGTAYEDENDLQVHCPGDNEEAHD